MEWTLFLKCTMKQFDNLGSFKSNYLIYVWGKGSLAKSDGSLAAPFVQMAQLLMLL